MTTRRVLLLAALTLACATTPSPPPDAGASPAADDVARLAERIELTRSVCFGRCPAYTVAITRDGVVEVTGDRDVVARSAAATAGRIAPATWARLVAAAQSSGFYTLPPSIRDDRSLCTGAVTDMPTETIRIVHRRADGRRRAIEVEHYQGCLVSFDPTRIAPRVEALAAFARAIDAAAGTSVP